MNEIKGLNRHMTKKQNWQKILQVTNLEKNQNLIFKLFQTFMDKL